MKAVERSILENNKPLKDGETTLFELSYAFERYNDLIQEKIKAFMDKHRLHRLWPSRDNKEDETIDKKYGISYTINYRNPFKVGMFGSAPELRDFVYSDYTRQFEKQFLFDPKKLANELTELLEEIEYFEVLQEYYHNFKTQSVNDLCELRIGAQRPDRDSLFLSFYAELFREWLEAYFVLEEGNPYRDKKSRIVFSTNGLPSGGLIPTSSEMGGSIYDAVSYVDKHHPGRDKLVIPSNDFIEFPEKYLYNIHVSKNLLPNVLLTNLPDIPNELKQLLFTMNKESKFEVLGQLITPSPSGGVSIKRFSLK